MAAEFRDYYQILGVPRDADDAAIKTAFRKLARQHHPDVAKDKGNAGEKFKEINEANEVLSDPEKRRKYDALAANWDPRERQGRHAWDGAADVHFEGTGFSDFFEQFFGGRSRAGGGTPGNGAGHARHGQDVEGDLLVTLEEALHGSTRSIGMRRTDPRTGQVAAETLRVRIPPGVREGQRIRVAGRGEAGWGGGDPGHLFLRVVLARHPDFRVRESTLYRGLDLAPWEAVLGATVSLPTLDGTVSLKVPPGTMTGRELRLRGRGLPTGTGARGDLHACVRVRVPPEVTPEQKALWEQLAAGATFQPWRDS